MTNSTETTTATLALDRILADTLALWKAHRERHPQLQPTATFAEVCAAEDCDGWEIQRIGDLLTPTDKDALRVLASDDRVWAAQPGEMPDDLHDATRLAVRSCIMEEALASSRTVNGKWRGEAAVTV